MTYWRNVGLTYLRYSRIAAQQVRKSLKADAKRDPLRDTSTIKISYKAEQKWNQSWFSNQNALFVNLIK